MNWAVCVFGAGVLVVIVTFFRFFGWVFVCIVARGIFGCFGMWGNVSFALVSALCTLVQILVFRG